VVAQDRKNFVGRGTPRRLLQRRLRDIFLSTPPGQEGQWFASLAFFLFFTRAAGLRIRDHLVGEMSWHFVVVVELHRVAAPRAGL